MPFINLQDIPQKELVPGFRVRFVHSENMTFSYWEVDEGAVLPEHSHPHEQVTTQLAGEFELTINGETRPVRPGDVAVIPSHTKHGGKARTRCYILDVFYPCREDYK